MGTALPGLAWRRSLPPLAVLGAGLLLLYRDTALGMAAIWLRSDSYTHALLVPPVVAWLVWNQRARLHRLAPRPAPEVLSALAATATLWMAGELVWVNGLTQFALTALLALSVPLLLGRAVARALLFPLGFLFFMVPAGEFLLPPFMEWTADVTVLALRASGIPVYREGLQFVIPSGPWSVAEACSGVRYLIASGVAGTLFAYLSYTSLRRRLAFVAAALVVPLLANWLRAYLIVVTAHLSGNRIAVGADHLIYGWVFFGLTMMPMFWIGARWAQPPRSVQMPDLPAPAPNPVPASAAAPWALAGAAAPWVLAGAALLLAALPHLALRALDGHAAPAAAAAAAPSLPAALAGGWVEAPPAAGWQPSFREPSGQAQRSYAAEGPVSGVVVGPVVGVHLAVYRQQSASRKMLEAGNGWLTPEAEADGGWRLVESGTHALSAAGTDASAPIATAVRSATWSGPAGQRLLAWQLYAVDGQLGASALQARAWIARQRLQGRGDEAATLTISTLLSPQDNLTANSSADSTATAQATLAGFLQDNRAALLGVLHAAPAPTLNRNSP